MRSHETVPRAPCRRVLRNPPKTLPAPAGNKPEGHGPRADQWTEKTQRDPMPQKAQTNPGARAVGGPTWAQITSMGTHVPNGVLVGPSRISRWGKAADNSLQKSLTRWSRHASKANTSALPSQKIATVHRKEATRLAPKHSSGLSEIVRIVDKPPAMPDAPISLDLTRARRGEQVLK